MMVAADPPLVIMASKQKSVIGVGGVMSDDGLFHMCLLLEEEGLWSV